MKKLFGFLMVGLAFTALQVATVQAEEDCSRGTQCFDDKQNKSDDVEAQSVDPTTVPPLTGDAAAKPSFGERVKSLFGVGAKDALPPTGAPGEPPVDVEIVDALGGGNAAAALAVDGEVDAASAARVQKCIDDMKVNEPGKDFAVYCSKVE